MNVGSDRGFTIIEVMVAIFLLLLGVLGVATMADTANRASAATKARVGAVNLAREMLEDARVFKYSDLTGAVPAVSGGSTALQDDFASVGITDAAPQSGFQVKRRGITYDVSVFTCVFDDNHDGARATVSGGAQDVNAAGPYCLGSATPGSTSTADSNPDDARKVEVDITWSLSGPAPSCKGANQTTTGGATGGLGRACVTQSALIADPSGGLGPAISSVTQTDPTTAVVETGDHVTFTVTTASPAQTVTWTADDGSGGSASAVGSGGTNWTFTWGPSPALPNDGTHSINVQAFFLGAGGVPKRVNVQLNRHIPDAPTVSGGGIDSRNATPAAAIKWVQSSDDDVIGYTVYRVPSGAAGPTPGATPDTPVCSTASPDATLCYDTTSSPTLDSLALNSNCPSGSPAAMRCIVYYVVPFDQKYTTAAEPSPYTSAVCPSMTWSSVTVPAPPPLPGSSVPPLQGSTAWGSARFGCPSQFVYVDYAGGIADAAPSPPGAAAPACSTNNGQPVINWVEPAATDTDGDPVQSYRIYRDTSNPPAYNDPSTEVGYGTAGATASFTDANATGASHTYYITAVDNHFQESTPPLIVHWPADCP